MVVVFVNQDLMININVVTLVDVGLIWPLLLGKVVIHTCVIFNVTVMVVLVLFIHLRINVNLQRLLQLLPRK